MAVKKGAKEIPANAKMESLEMEVGARSYHIFAYFMDGEGDGIDFELKVGKQTDVGKKITATIEAMKAHPNRKVR